MLVYGSIMLLICKITLNIYSFGKIVKREVLIITGYSKTQFSSTIFNDISISLIPNSFITT